MFPFFRTGRRTRRGIVIVVGGRRIFFDVRSRRKNSSHFARRDLFSVNDDDQPEINIQMFFVFVYQGHAPFDFRSVLLYRREGDVQLFARGDLDVGGFECEFGLGISLEGAVLVDFGEEGGEAFVGLREGERIDHRRGDCFVFIGLQWGRTGCRLFFISVPLVFVSIFPQKIGIPLLKLCHQFLQTSIQIIVDQNHVKVPLLRAKLHLPLGILQPFQNRLFRFRPSSAQSLFEFFHGGWSDEDVIGSEVGCGIFLDVLDSLDVYV
mmetsp:Transcript_29028/g.61118  ORF Transcript_29028/g.61118 Transcript_29028/m.61118 type:complete len:265 (+) Transcript_29028:853-1647(+)